MNPKSYASYVGMYEFTPPLEANPQHPSPSPESPTGLLLRVGFYLPWPLAICRGLLPGSTFRPFVTVREAVRLRKGEF